MKKVILNAGFLSALFFVVFGCTAIPSAGTHLYVYDKVKSVQIGNTPEQVIYLMDGEPTTVTALNEGASVFEVWEYRVGNFIYSQSVVVLFKDRRVFALPKSAQELLGVLYASGVVHNAQFWDYKQK